MKKLITLFAIVALFGSCKKEPIETPEPVQHQSKMFSVELQSSEPTGSFFGYTLTVNGSDTTSPATVNTGDSVKVEVFDPLGHPYILKCYIDNVNVYPNGNYQYDNSTWIYTIQ